MLDDDMSPPLLPSIAGLSPNLPAIRFPFRHGFPPAKPALLLVPHACSANRHDNDADYHPDLPHLHERIHIPLNSTPQT
jgi:hypothetical protein